jgi:UDP-N-acetylglucosamine transferase subunit ALG13
VIFVTVGTDPRWGFDRLIKALDQLTMQDLVVQHGPATPPAGVKEVHQWLTFDQVLRFMAEADAVISHAGVGTILCASRAGHIPIVMPRLKRFGETVDDHQAEVARMFERTGKVTVAWDAASLRDCVARSRKRNSPATLSDGRLQDAVRSALRGAQP